MRYATALADARREFDEWDAGAKTIAFQVDHTVYVHVNKPRRLRCGCGKRAVRAGRCETCRTAERSEQKPPCKCGRPYFAAGQCRPCYFRAYNTTRVRKRVRKSLRQQTAKRLLSVLPLMACNPAPDARPDRCQQVSRVVVTLDKLVLIVGESTHARATVYDLAGDTIPGCRVVWSSSDTTVAKVLP
jgi:hypothetical protein